MFVVLKCLGVCKIIVNQSVEQPTNPEINAFSMKYWKLISYLSLYPPQAAINAMNLEQQLSQYAFFNQQPSSQTHQSQQVSFSQQKLSYAKTSNS